MKKDTSSYNANTDGHPLSVWRALLIGWVWVTVPAVIIMLGVFFLGATIEFRLWWLFLAIGGFLGWTWWSFTIVRWWRWSVSRGVPPNRLHKWAVMVLLIWPRGSIFEKTEIRPKD
jgi:hypothetical protein